VNLRSRGAKHGTALQSIKDIQEAVETSEKKKPKPGKKNLIGADRGFKDEERVGEGFREKEPLPLQTSGPRGGIDENRPQGASGLKPSAQGTTVFGFMKNEPRAKTIISKSPRPWPCWRR